MVIDKKKLLEAMAETDPEVQYFVDRKLGTLRKVSLKEPETIARFKEDFAKDQKRFLKIPKRSGAEKYAELNNFIKLVADAALRKKFSEALMGPNPHREFRLLMERRFKEQHQWEEYCKKLAEERLADFLKVSHLG